MAKTPHNHQEPAVPTTNKGLVGRLVHYYTDKDAEPQAAIIQRMNPPVEGESVVRLDLFVFGVASQGLAQSNAQRVPFYRESPPERCREWCEPA